MLRPLPTFYGRRKRFPLDPDALCDARILVPIILRYPADLVGVPSGGCPSATWHHYLGRNNSKGEHRRVRVPPNHPMSSLFCNINQNLGVYYRTGCTESDVEEHNETFHRTHHLARPHTGSKCTCGAINIKAKHSLSLTFGL